MRYLTLFLVWSVTIAGAFGQESSLANPPKELPNLESFRASNADPAVNPCDDFFAYADGRWIASHPIPADQVGWGVGSPLDLWNQVVLVKALEKVSADDPKRTPDEQRVGDYYYACMDTKTIDAQTANWLKPELARIAEMRSKREIAAEVAHQHQTIPGATVPGDNQTSVALMGFSAQPDFADATHDVATIDQGGMGMPAKSFYLDQDDKSKEIREKYRVHVANMFVLAGEPAEQAKRDAATVLEIETELAKGMMDPVTRRDPNKINNPMSLVEVKALTPSFDWDSYLKLVKAPVSQRYIVTSPDFFKSLEVTLSGHSLEEWKTYLRWQMLNGNANGLSGPYVNENFDFFGRTLYGVQELEPRWRRCVRSVDRSMGEALGQVYVKQAFSPEDKERALKMVKGVEAALSHEIEMADWMTPATKKEAQTKLSAVMNKIGYPDTWRDYSALTITRASNIENRHNAADFEFERSMKKIGKPVDRTEWIMTPPTVNAYEDPQYNTINFPAGILQPPYFEASQDDAVNDGATGATIGHELIHGFDDQGRKFDARGNLRDWWTANDAKEYETRGKCISDQYTQPIPEAGPGVKQNGKMTQGEDTADIGGLHLALLTLETQLAKDGKSLNTKGPDGFTELQRFFLSYAFSFCEYYRPELIRTVVLTNPHSYSKYRVNNVVSNFPEFWQAFGCHDGQKMVRVAYCRIW
jgi:putative endopeptidase